MKRFRTLTLVALSISLLSAKCGGEPINPAVEFDKKKMLTNYGEKIILPSLTDLQTNVGDLKSAFVQFSGDLSIANLENLQTAWKSAYIQFQHSQIFNFGPSMDFGLKGAFGTYPTDTTKINQNIANGSYYLATASNTDAIGFPALDYLLYDLSTSNAFARLMSDNNRLTYVEAVILKMESEINAIVDAWNNGYLSEFKENSGTSSTSSLSYLVNEWNKDYELSKVAKLGIPIGEKSLGIAQPEYLEAPYSGVSMELLKESMLALEESFKGDYKGEDGIGFEDYIQSFADQGPTLNSTISSTFSSIHDEIETYASTSLKAEIEAENEDLFHLYDLIQSQVVNTKTDMPALFGIMITYQDNDGD
mgnify:CR=1 FL=1